MRDEKYRCSKCKAFEVVLVERSANHFDTRPARYVCQKCGHEYPIDSHINIFNRNTINTFPNPKVDLDVKKKFKKEVD